MFTRWFRFSDLCAQNEKNATWVWPGHAGLMPTLADLINRSYMHAGLSNVHRFHNHIQTCELFSIFALRLPSLHLCRWTVQCAYHVCSAWRIFFTTLTMFLSTLKLWQNRELLLHPQVTLGRDSSSNVRSTHSRRQWFSQRDVSKKERTWAVHVFCSDFSLIVWSLLLGSPLSDRNL